MDYKIELKEWTNKRNIQKSQAISAVDSIMSLWKNKPENADIVWDWEVAEELGKRLFNTESHITYFPELDRIYQGWVTICGEYVKLYCQTIWDKQVNCREDYSDADYYVTKVKETKDLRVFTLFNAPTFSPDNYWIIIEDLKHSRIDVRIITNKRQTKYGKKTLSFWKKRKYSLEYIKEFQYTDLGGVYGDARDPGYVFTFKYYTEFSVTEGNIYYLNQQKCFLNTLENVYKQLTENETDTEFLQQD